MSIPETFAMATNNRKEPFFCCFPPICFLFWISWNSPVLWKRSRAILSSEKNEKFIYRLLKNLTVSYFWLKKRNPVIKFRQKNILWRRHLYHEVYKLSQNFTEGNKRKVSACFLHLHDCDIIQFRDDHARMRIRGPLAPVAYTKF